MTLAPLDLRTFPPVGVNIEPPETLSQTLMAKHDRCPRSAYLSRKYRGGTGSHALDRGIAYHAFHQRAVETMIESQEPTMPGEVATELADAVMAERVEDLHLPAASQDVVRLCAHNWAEATVLDLEAIIGVEVPLEVGVHGWRFTCRVDLVEVYDSTLVVRDQKTSLHIRRQEEVEKGFQGLSYAFAALHGEVPESAFTLGSGISDVRFIEEYPRYRTEEGPLVAREVWWDRKQIHEFQVSLERNIAAFERSLESGEWPARDGSWCGECPAPRECPIPAHLRAQPEIADVEQARDAFSLKQFYDREGRAIQAALREFVKESGPFVHGDYIFDATPSETRSVDWEAAAQGRPLEEVVSKRTSTRYAARKATEEEINAG